MKKITTKVLTIVAACAAMVFASCAQPSTSGSGAGAGYTLPEGAVELQLYRKNADEVTDNDKASSVKIGADCAKPFAFVKDTDLTEVKVGAKIYFTLECAAGESMRLQNLDWAYLADSIVNAVTGTTVTPTTSEWNGQTDYNYGNTGHYYFVVTEDTKNKLAKGIEIHGNKATVSKFAYVNPAN